MANTYTGFASSLSAFVRVGYNDNGDGLIEYSDDGSVWVPGLMDVDILASLPMRDVVRSDGLFVAVGQARVMVSIDGLSWAWVSGITESDWRCVAAFGALVMVGGSGTLIYSDDTGYTWRDFELPDEFYDQLTTITNILLEGDSYYITGTPDLYATGPITDLSPFRHINGGLVIADSVVPFVPQHFAEVQETLLMFGGDQRFVQVRENLSMSTLDFPAISNPAGDVVEDMALIDSSKYAIPSDITETLNLLDSIILLDNGESAEIIELLLLNDNTEAAGRYYRTIVENLRLDDLFGKVLGQALIVERLTLEDRVAAVKRFLREITEGLALSETTKAAFTRACADMLTFNEVTKAAFARTLIDALVFDTFAGATYVDEPVGEDTEPGLNDTHQAWAYNTEGRQSSRYTNANYTSMVSTEAGVYATDGTTLFCLEGSTDAGAKIRSYIEWGVTDFGTAMEKRAVEAYLGVTSTGQLVLRIITDQKTEDWYQVVLDEAGEHGARIKSGKGLKARYWKFRLENFDGEGFDIESAAFRPVTLSRRVR